MAKPLKPWYRSSKGTWYARIGGRMVSLGVRGRASKAEAVAAWHRHMAAGAKPHAERNPEPTVGDVITAFLADAEGRLRPNTVAVYKALLTPFSEKHGQMLASRLTPEAAQAYAARPTWSQSTRHDFLGVLSMALRLAERTGRAGANPLRHMKRPPMASRGDKAIVSADDHARLLAAAPAYFKPFLRLLHLTGARPGEIASIRAEDFDAGNGLVRLSEHKTARHGRKRIIFLPPEAVTILREQQAVYASGQLLRGRWGASFTKNAVVRMFARLRRTTGIVHATAYGYRHGFATDALASGVPDAHVAELLGHSGTAMLHKHYAHLSARANVLRSALASVRQHGSTCLS